MVGRRRLEDRPDKPAVEALVDPRRDGTRAARSRRRAVCRGLGSDVDQLGACARLPGVERGRFQPFVVEEVAVAGDDRVGARGAGERYEMVIGPAATNTWWVDRIRQQGGERPA
jgi:hypothetical protein